MERLVPMYDKLTSERMKMLVRSAKKKNRSSLRQQSNQEWDKVIEGPSGEEG
jgi:hypothetical protein